MFATIMGVAACALCFSAMTHQARADFDSAAVVTLTTSLETALKLPWLTVDFDAELIESGAALTDNYTVIDVEVLNRALFSGIRASGEMVGLFHCRQESLLRH